MAIITQALLLAKRYWLPLIAAAIAFIAGAILVFAALEADRIRNRLADMFASAPERQNTISTDWRKIETALLTIERLDVPLGNVDGSATGGAIEEFAGHVLYASANGHLAALNTQNGSLTYSEIRVPMDYDRVRRDVFADKIQFNQNWYRVHDLLVKDHADGTADLYVSHHVFQAGDQSICNVVSQTRIAQTETGILFDPDWTEIYRLDACIQMLDYDWDFSGHMSGGRMVEFDDNNLLLTVGEFGLANFLSAPELVSPDSGNQLAKVLKLNLETNDVSIFATGVRNPQGLMRDRFGKFWETEHAAQGGDEVNLLREGADYGWPNVALGTEYGSPRTPFPRTPEQGRHDGYEMPVYSFVPSIAIGNLIALPGGDSFDLWRDDFLVTSLVDETLYRLRPEGERIVYAEPIKMNQRLRDIILLDNGWVAMLTGNRSLIFLRDASIGSAAGETGFAVSGYDAVQPLEAKARQFVGEYSWGRDLYRGKCASCHRVDGRTEVAPPLNGIIGRQIASHEGYPYSEALENARGRWSTAKLSAFIENPQSVFPGTAMAAIQMDKYERRALVEYLEGLED
ncbi:MAG: PQQ-dependent sugar dehydrogenase [Pseudomonadota bacterium]